MHYSKKRKAAAVGFSDIHKKLACLFIFHIIVHLEQKVSHYLTSLVNGPGMFSFFNSKRSYFVDSSLRHKFILSESSQYFC